MTVASRRMADRIRGWSRRRRVEGQVMPGKQRPVMVAEPPRIRGPLSVEGNPILVEYEIVARLSLPEPDTEVTPSISFMESSERGEYIDVRWTTTDSRAPRGIWERSTVITLPRQFAVATYTVTEETPLLEREAGA
ncbi:MAG TPA: hypothetical protein VE268_10100 [Herpetosiphonaceae bacterium]|nr:hypothetical protein [Herpetosiphonaceae bacterium]